MDQEASQRRVTVATVATGLRRVLRHGVRPARLQDHDDLLHLNCVLERAGSSADERALPFALEAVLLEALAGIGDGPWGRAARALFGATPATRGLPLMQRRMHAADELNLSASTFRQNYEGEVVDDLAAEVVRGEVGREQEWANTQS